MIIKTMIKLLSTAFLCQFLFTGAATSSETAKDLISSATVQSSGRYTLQVSSSREASDAADQVASLKARGLYAVSSYESVEGKGMWYRVYAGRFETRKEAEAAGARLKADGIISGYWIRVLKGADELASSSTPARTEQSSPKKEKAAATKEQSSQSAKAVNPQVVREEEVKHPVLQSPAVDKDGGSAVPAAETKTGTVSLVVSRPPENGITDDQTRPIESQTHHDDQTEAPSTYLQAEGKGAIIMIHEGETDADLVEKIVSQASVNGTEDDSNKTIEQPPAQHDDQTDAQRQLPLESEKPTAHTGEPAGKPVKEVLEEPPAHKTVNDNEGRLSVAVKPESLYFPGLDKFTISSQTTFYYFNEKYLSAAIVPSFSFNRSFALESSFEKILNSKFDFLYATLGPKWRLIPTDDKGLFNLSPYIRGAFAGGDMSWDEAPGSFDTGLGWELGAGLDLISLRSNLKLGLETSYRSIRFNYHTPSGQGVTSSQNRIDFSGVSFTGFMSFNF